MNRTRWEALLASIGAGLAATGCGPDGDDDKAKTAVDEYVEIQEGWVEDYCAACLVGNYYSTLEECVDGVGQQTPDAVVECTSEWLADHPATKAYFECSADAARDYIECLGEPTCEDEVFTCGNGEQVPQGYVCDGYDDCGDGSDEDQNCGTSCNVQYWSAQMDCPEVPAAEAEALYDECGWYLEQYEYEYEYDAGHDPTGLMSEESATVLRPHPIPLAARLTLRPS